MIHSRAFFLILVIALAASLVACAGNGESSSDSAAPATTSDSTTVEQQEPTDVEAANEEEPAPDQQAIPEEANNLPQDLVGRWTRIDSSGDARSWTFNADGAGNQDGIMEFTWKSLEPGKLTVMGANGIGTGCAYRVDGDALFLDDVEWRRE